MLTLTNVSVTFAGRPAVDDVSLTAAGGDWIGLIGPNGAGKSTLLRAIAGLQHFRGGIHFYDASLAGMSHRARARIVAYVPQNPEKPAGMTVMDYALLGRTPHIGYLGVESAEDHAHCWALLQRLGIAELARRTLPTLSGGEMQRAVLARALALQAPVLLLDEPTSALDLGNRIEALELVDDLRRERNLIVLSAIHDLTLAAQFTDRLVLLDAGRRVAAGTPDEVLTAPLLSRHFGGTVQVLTDATGALIVAPIRSRVPDALARGEPALTDAADGMTLDRIAPEDSAGKAARGDAADAGSSAAGRADAASTVNAPAGSGAATAHARKRS